jgi:primosomal protein N' (replication factor Y)
VAGRAGRGDLDSRVVIQTYSPTHPAIVAAQKHDFQGFYEYEARERREAVYPPFTHLVNALFAGPDLTETTRAAEQFAEATRTQPGWEVFGPVQAPLAMLRGMHRLMVLIKLPTLDGARPHLRQALAPCQRPGVRVVLDLDPYSML